MGWAIVLNPPGESRADNETDNSTCNVCYSCMCDKYKCKMREYSRAQINITTPSQKKKDEVISSSKLCCIADLWKVSLNRQKMSAADSLLVIRNLHQSLRVTEGDCWEWARVLLKDTAARQMFAISIVEIIWVTNCRAALSSCLISTAD